MFLQNNLWLPATSFISMEFGWKCFWIGIAYDDDFNETNTGKIVFLFSWQFNIQTISNLSSYSCALKYIIYPVFWWLIRIILIALETFKRLWFTDHVLSQWPFDWKVDCLKSLANCSNAWSLSVWTHKPTDI